MNHNQTPKSTNRRARPRPSGLKLLCVSALLAALSMVLGKYLAINVTDSIRLSFENLPVLMAGIFLGPLAGAAVGTVADLLGCILVGYSINPIITAGAALIGLLSGLVARAFTRGGRSLSPLGIYTAVYTAHIVGSMVVKSIGLAVYFSTPIPVLAIRIPVYLVVGALEGTVILLLARNRLFTGELKKIMRY